MTSRSRCTVPTGWRSCTPGASSSRPRAQMWPAGCACHMHRRSSPLRRASLPRPTRHWWRSLAVRPHPDPSGITVRSLPGVHSLMRHATRQGRCCNPSATATSSPAGIRSDRPVRPLRPPTIGTSVPCSTDPDVANVAARYDRGVPALATMPLRGVDDGCAAMIGAVPRGRPSCEGCLDGRVDAASVHVTCSGFYDGVVGAVVGASVAVGGCTDG